MSFASIVGTPPVIVRGNTTGGYHYVAYPAPPASSNTWSAWFELLASAPIDADALLVQEMMDTLSSMYGSMFGMHAWIEVGVGAAGSERVVGRFIKATVTAAPIARVRWHLLPVAIPRGSRVAARIRVTADMENYDDGSGQIGVALIPRSGTFPAGCRQYAHVGAPLVAGEMNAGTPIDPGTTPNTWGAWTLLGTAPLAAQWAMFAWYCGDDGGYSFYEVELGVGASGSQVAHAAALVRQWGSSGLQPPPPALPVRIPAGASVWIRAKSQHGSGFRGNRILNCSVGLFG